MREKINKARKNKKGFSLVELIVVIAIMAVLVAILAPQFLKYVERSRRSSDVANVNEIATSIQTYAADTEKTTEITTGATVVLTSGTSGKATFTDAGITQAFTDAGIAPKGLKSTKWGSVTITVTVETNGTTKVTVSNDGTDTAYNIADATGLPATKTN